MSCVDHTLLVARKNSTSKAPAVPGPSFVIVGDSVTLLPGETNTGFNVNAGERRLKAFGSSTVTCHDTVALQNLAEFTLAHRHRPLVTIGMGAAGAASRIFFPALGSLLTYTFLGAPTAPGQLTCEETLHYLTAFYPTRMRRAQD